MNTFADRILAFYKQLKITTRLPKGVEVLNPYQEKIAFDLCQQFYRKYYADNGMRKVILGINPGRLGGGITGIPFTDPIKLEKICSIKNDLQKKAELSADFIYMMIEAYGGPEVFYRDYFFNSVSPLGFTSEGKNLNYYDIPALMKALEKFIHQSLTQVTALGTDRRIAYCLGEGQNYKYLIGYNERYKLFEEIRPLPHPRFIMQYKRNSLDQYIKLYVEALKA